VDGTALSGAHARKTTHSTSQCWPPWLHTRYTTSATGPCRYASVNASYVPWPVRVPTTLQPRQVNMLVINVNANVGAGKTTFCKQRSGVARTAVVLETFNAELLKRAYQGWDKFAFQLSMAGNTTTGSLAMAKRQVDTMIRDRGPYGNLAFALMAVRNGELNKEQWLAYCDMFERDGAVMRDLLGIKTEQEVFVDIGTALCMDRVRQRARHGEESVNTVYLDAIRDAHALVWAWGAKHRPHGVDFLVADTFDSEAKPVDPRAFADVDFLSGSVQDLASVTGSVDADVLFGRVTE
jgi:deoxyadenosine/deoxycytidine kinase